MTLKCHITVQNNTNQCHIKTWYDTHQCQNKVTNRYQLQKKFLYESHKNVVKTSIIIFRSHMYIVLNKYYKFYVFCVDKVSILLIEDLITIQMGKLNSWNDGCNTIETCYLVESYFDVSKLFICIWTSPFSPRKSFVLSARLLECFFNSLVYLCQNLTFLLLFLEVH